MRSTHTYVTMEVSHATHREVMTKLLAADYHHAIDGNTIDMHGLALVLEPPPTIEAEADGICIQSDGTIMGTPERIEEFRVFCRARGKLLEPEKPPVTNQFV